MIAPPLAIKRIVRSEADAAKILLDAGWTIEEVNAILARSLTASQQDPQVLPESSVKFTPLRKKFPLSKKRKKFPLPKKFHFSKVIF